MKNEELSRGFKGFYGILTGKGLDDFAGLKTTDADIDAADGPIGEFHLYALEIGEKTPAGDAGDLFTHAARFFGQTAAGDGASYDGLFVTNGTVLHGE